MKSAPRDLRIAACAFLVIILAFAIYANSLGGKFVWDDHILIKDNPLIKSWVKAPLLFLKSTERNSPDNFRPWRPVQTLSYALDYSVWRLNPVGYHLTNIALHILAAIAVFWMVNLLFRDNLLALFTSLFFVSHPVHTEAVAYISGRADPLACVFIVLALIFYVKDIRGDLPHLRALAALFYALALFSRESAIAMLLILGAYHYVFKRRVIFKSLMPIAAITAVYAILRLAIASPAAQDGSLGTPITRLPGFFAAFLNYLRLEVLPVGLHMEYGRRIFKATDPQVVLGLIAFIFILYYTYKNRRKDRVILFSVLWFFASILPQSNIYPLNAYMAEHWLYLPSVGFSLFVSRCFVRAFEGRYKTAVLAAAVCLILFLSFMTVIRNEYWKDPVKLYESTMKHAPYSKSARSNLAMLYADMGRRDEAIALYREAIALDPGFATPYNNLGKLYADMGRRDEAALFYRKAIAIKPDYAIAYNNLGNVYSDNGRNKEAVILYRKAVELDPHLALAYNNLGNRYAEAGETNDAAVFYRKAIYMDPDFALVYYNLARLYYRAGEVNMAAMLLNKALASDPDLAVAREALKNISGASPREGAPNMKGSRAK